MLIERLIYNLELQYEYGDDEFEYEIPDDDLCYYIFNHYSYDDILYEYLYEIYPTLDERDKEWLCDYGFYGSYEDIEEMDEDQKDQLAKDVVYDLLDTGWIERELHDYFVEDAIEAYKDAEEYNRDPYALLWLTSIKFLLRGNK